MSEETRRQIENIRAKIAAKREEKFRTKLADLMNEMEAQKSADDFFINEMLIPSSS